jgi:glycosyltransferase involved in cell wall biosynthesis
VRICLVYDCLYPYTIGGAERWYRNLALRLAADGHEVTYLTMRQWKPSEPPELPGVHVVAVAPRLKLYVRGRRRIWPPLVFGLGVLWHLIVNGSRYDVVHTASFPYFSLVAAGLLQRRQRYRLVVDWHEVWTRDYWREYLGLMGSVGASIQAYCLRIPQEAFCFSQLHAERLRSEGFVGPITVLRGQYEGSFEPGSTTVTEPRIVFAGRHIPEKGVTAIAPALARAREEVPELTATIFGDGPDRTAVVRQVHAYGLQRAVEVLGFVAETRIDEALRHALCLLLPSRREGYGLIVVEALARGTPAVVVASPDNAAVEFIEEGVNGFIAASAEPEDLAEAIVRVYRAGPALREATGRWFQENARSLSLSSSLDAVAATYRGGRSDG